MDYGILPPEFNSSRMYSGPGSAPMLAAAEAWQSLAAELHSTANSYQSVISGLTAGSWSGPSSASMAAAATSYTAWLTATATQAEESATQAQAAAAAYQAAFTATVPPQLVATNRSQLTTLVATNTFGRNTQAIALNEAQYAEMWAQDAAAMYGYAAASSSATSLTPFTPPQLNTNPGGLSGQAAAISQATGTSAGNAASAVASAQQAMSAVPSALTSAAAPAAIPTNLLNTLDLLSDLITIFIDLPADLATFAIDIPAGVLSVIAFPLDIIGAGTGLHTDDIISGWNGEEPWPGKDPAPVKPFPATLLNLPAGTVPPPTLEAGLGEANVVGSLSVPPSWTIATPAVRPTSYTLPALPQTAVTAATAGQPDSASTLSEVALAGMAGRAMAGTIGAGGGRGGAKAAQGGRAAVRAERSASTGQRTTAEGNDEQSESKPRPVVTGVAAELREFTKLRDEGILTEQEYTEQKNRLLGR